MIHCTKFMALAIISQANSIHMLLHRSSNLDFIIECHSVNIIDSKLCFRIQRSVPVGVFITVTSTVPLTRSKPIVYKTIIYQRKV